MTAPAARPLRLGVIGTSSMAERRVLPTVTRMPEWELVAVAGRAAKKAARFAQQFDCAAEEDAESLLERTDVDAVYVSTPTALHRHWTETALQAGKHVLVEKPIGVDAAEARSQCALAAERGLALRENFMFLHHPQHARVRELVADGRVGGRPPSVPRSAFRRCRRTTSATTPGWAAARCSTSACTRCGPPCTCSGRDWRWPGRRCAPAPLTA